MMFFHHHHDDDDDPLPNSNLQLWYEDVFIVAFNLSVRVCNHGVGVGDLRSAVTPPS